MNKCFYPAIFSKEKEYYNVRFIDFDDIFNFGIGFDNAYYMAKDALSLRLLDYDNKLPVPTIDYKNVKLKNDEFIVLVGLN